MSAEASPTGHGIARGTAVDAGAEGGVPRELVRAGVDGEHVAVRERAEAIEGCVDLAFPIEGGPQDRRAVVGKGQRQVGHERAV